MPTIESGGTPFNKISLDVIREFESITPTQRALAVPRVLIWRASPSFERLGAPLTLTTSAPPSFGQSGRFPERPDVSLERLSVTVRNPISHIGFREINLSFVVHRPEALEAEDEGWGSLFVLGRFHLLEYGWSAPPRAGPLLDGSGVSSREGSVPGSALVLFQVTDYKFTINPDNSMRFDVKGMDQGDLLLRKSFLFPTDDVDPNNPAPNAVVGERLYEGLSSLSPLFEKLPTVRGAGRRPQKLIRFGDILDTLISPSLLRASPGATIHTWDFNPSAGGPSQKFAPAGSPPKNISEFAFPADFVQRALTDIQSNGRQMTITNVLRMFLTEMSLGSSWIPPNDDPRTPEVLGRLLRRDNRIELHIFDLRREVARLGLSDFNGRTRADVRKYVEDRGVPYVRLMTGLSYIETVSFDIVQDQLLAANLIHKALAVDDRKEVTSEPRLKNSRMEPINPAVYSPVLLGDIQMMGNFAFDVQSLIWLDFGVSRWDGPFTVQQREDILTLGSFTTRIRVQQEGSDPLGTRRRGIRRVI